MTYDEIMLISKSRNDQLSCTFIPTGNSYGLYHRAGDIQIQEFEK